MGSQTKRWIVRNQDGHIYGPFDTQKIRELLARSILTGDEQVAEYPVGDWRPMSGDAELYDLVLENLSRPKIRPQPAKKEAVNESTTTDSQKEITPFRQILGQTTSRKIKREEKETTQSKVNIPPPPPPKKKAPDIELTDRAELIKKYKPKVIPLALAAVAVGLIIYSVLPHRFLRKPAQVISLLDPHITKKNDPVRSQQLEKEGWTYFYRDTFSNYMRAEEKFVRAVEESPSNSSALVMLALADLELWPYARQDSDDQTVLRNILQLASKADLYGTRRAMTSIALDMMLSREANARTQIDTNLVTQPSEGRLYELKAQLFFDSNDYQHAIDYFDKAAKLIPHWVKPIYMIGVCYSKLGNGSQAQQYLLQALNLNSNHAAARLELGVVEAQFFGHDDKAREFLNLAFDSEERLPSFTEARGRYRLAALLDKIGERRRAREQAEMAIRLNPLDPDVKELLTRLGGSSAIEETDDRQHMAMGQQYLRSGNFFAAAAQFQAAFEADPHNARAAMLAAQAYWKLHRSKEAFDFLQKSTNADSKFLDSYILLSDYRSQVFDFEGAAAALHDAQRVSPKSPLVYRGSALVLLRQGDLQGAEKSAADALKLYEVDFETNRLMAEIQLSKKNITKAVQYAKRAIEIDSGSAEAQVTLAKVKAAAEGVKEAQDYLADLINTYPAQLAYRVGLAEIVLKDDQYDVAKQILLQVVGADEKNKEAFLLLGDACFLGNNLDQAVSYYLRAAAIDPGDPAGFFRTGEVYLRAKKPDEALKEFQYVDNANPHFPRTHYNRARAYMELGMLDQALEETEKEKKENPRLADPYELGGDLYLISKRFGLAVEQYRKAQERRLPQGAALYVKLAKAYRGENAFDTALSMLREAAAKESGYAEIYRERGEIYSAKGMVEEAISSFQQYLKLEPNPPDKEAILGKIKDLE